MTAVSFEFEVRQFRRPEDATRVRLDVFEGPLALLLALIEQRQLDILTVRLGDLTGAYLEAVARLESGQLPLLSSFVAVSAQLILIKSRALLPRPPVIAAAPDETDADPEEELRRRLIEYRMFRDAAAVLGQRLATPVRLFQREADAASAAGRAGARSEVIEPLDSRLLADVLLASVRLVPPLPPVPESITRTVTLEDRAAVIRAALRHAPAIVLQELLGNVTDRIVVAVTFLALLELAKGREVVIEQAEPWGPIRVTAGRTGPYVGQRGAQLDGG